MKLYLLISFYLGIILFICRLITMATADFPVKREPLSIGVLCAETILGMLFTIWAGILLSQ